MQQFKAVVHYHFKKGKEMQGLKFLENNLLKQAQEMGCHYIEMLQCERDPTYVIGIAVWSNINEARRFQSTWDRYEQELLQFCTKTPEREFFKIKGIFEEKGRKAA